MTEANIDLVLDCADLDVQAAFWSKALAYDEIGRKDQYVLLRSSERAFPPLLLQRVAEPKTAKNRMHWDIRTDEVDAKVAELESLGARRIDVGQPADSEFIVMADPEGNEFCVCPGAPLG
ncbi:MAG: VOC family protein [Actinomycetota bacterium]|nr:VOC family protein [Actinomycetota bacterium]